MLIVLHSLVCSALSISVVSSIAFQSRFKNPTPSSLELSKASTVANATSLDHVGHYAHIACEGLYGHNLQVGSCDNALGKIPQNSATLIFGVRGTGNWDVQLPARYLSGVQLLASIYVAVSCLQIRILGML